jgi:hypothetical protein
VRLAGRLEVVQAFDEAASVPQAVAGLREVAFGEPALLEQVQQRLERVALGEVVGELFLDERDEVVLEGEVRLEVAGAGGVVLVLLEQHVHVPEGAAEGLQAVLAVLVDGGLGVRERLPGLAEVGDEGVGVGAVAGLVGLRVGHTGNVVGRPDRPSVALQDSRRTEPPGRDAVRRAPSPVRRRGPRAARGLPRVSPGGLRGTPP